MTKATAEVRMNRENGYCYLDQTVSVFFSLATLWIMAITDYIELTPLLI